MPATIQIYEQTISELLAIHQALLVTYPTEKIWNANGVSLQRRLDADPELSGRIDSLLTEEKIQSYIVPAKMSAPTRCIDGRITQGWNDATAQSRVLGPKIAGGTAHAALAHRIVDIENITHELRFETDIQHVISEYKKIGIGFGGHIDDNQHGSSTGCGAVDNINLILDRLQRPEPQEQLRGITKEILGDAFDQAITNEVIGRMLYIDALKPRYMPKENDDPRGEFLYKKTIVETIRHEAAANEETVPSLVGSHNEIGIVLNFVSDTTFDNDRFSSDNNNELQLFGWDVWEMYEEARSLYPYNMHEAVHVQRTSIDNRMRHITTRTLLCIATLMVLTDGSLRFISVTK